MPGRSPPTISFGCPDERRPLEGDLVAADGGDELRAQDTGEGLIDVPEICHQVDVPALERVLEPTGSECLARRLGQGRRDEHGQVEPGLSRCVCLDAIVQRRIDEDVRRDAEDGGGQDDEGNEREGQPGPDTAHHLRRPLSGRPCSRRPAR